MKNNVSTFRRKYGRIYLECGIGGYFFKQNEKYINHKGKNAYT